MGASQSQIYPIKGASKQHNQNYSKNCDTKCQNKNKLNTLLVEKGKNEIFRNELNSKLYEVNSKINSVKYGKKKLEEIRVSNEIKKLNRYIGRHNKLNNQLISEFDTRINLYLKQYKFYTKNNIIITDLEKKIKYLDETIRKKTVDNTKNIRKIDHIKKDLNELELDLSKKRKLSMILIIILFILVGLFIYLKRTT